MKNHQLIIQVTKCSPTEAPEIERIMTRELGYAPLEFLTGPQLVRGATDAKIMYDFFTSENRYCAMLGTQDYRYYIDDSGKIQQRKEELI